MERTALSKDKKPLPPVPHTPVGAEFTREQLTAMYGDLARSIYDADRKCPWCHKEMNVVEPLCRECQRPAPRPICPNCHSPLYIGAKVCWGCKWKIDQAEAMRVALEMVVQKPLVVKGAAPGTKPPKK